ncbi:hypothetical protein PS918_00633 [Pseudomonas fluorescens]|uniref:Uncharacterized protein n=1 Tax=Pseudomonas fluorescens TaxID=294 RepID=A0A5E7R355_PSEFL|nr:hypothetical protein [Pseudomonas fluorescens]VVP67807.1 hypothetical protein PS918_00633 [Pseudomonas fluorescens]
MRHLVWSPKWLGVDRLRALRYGVVFLALLPSVCFSGSFKNLDALAPLAGSNIIDSVNTPKTTLIRTDEGLFLYDSGAFKEVELGVGNLDSKVQSAGGKSANDEENALGNFSRLLLRPSPSGAVWIVQPGQSIYLALGGKVTDLGKNLPASTEKLRVVGVSGDKLWLSAGGSLYGLSEGEEALKKITLKKPLSASAVTHVYPVMNNADSYWIVLPMQVALASTSGIHVLVDWTKTKDEDPQSIGKHLLSSNGDLWFLAGRGNQVYWLQAANGQLNQHDLGGPALDMVQRKNGDVLVQMEVGGIRIFSNGEWHVWQVPGGTQQLESVNSISGSYDGTGVVLALGTAGLALFEDDSAKVYTLSLGGLSVREVVRVQTVGPSAYLIYGKDGTLQVLEGTRFSDIVSLQGAPLSVSNTLDGSLWVSGLNSFYRYNHGSWSRFKIRTLADPIVRTVLRLEANSYLFDSPQTGFTEYVASKGRLLLEDVNPETRTASVRLDLPEEELTDSNLNLHYSLSVSPTDFDRDQTIRLIAGKAQISVPVSFGSKMFLSAEVRNEYGDVYHLGDTTSTPLKMPAPVATVAEGYLTGFIVKVPWIIGAHMALWCGLLMLYPYSPALQASVFWNRSVRKSMSLWYVEVLLLAVPYARKRLIQPFASSMKGDARLDLCENYFEDIEIRDDAQGTICNPAQLAATLRGHTIVRGPSGAGKTHLLRYLILHRKQQAVFLTARACSNGVLEAIAEKLPSQLRDFGLVESLIFHSSLDVYIDGLNEVSPEIRERISSFMQSFPKACVVISTQRFKWNAPSTVTSFDLQPLSQQRIEQYLLRVGPDTENYTKAVGVYLSRRKNENTDQRYDSQASTTPYDLSIVSRLLRNGVLPNAFDIQQQYFEYVVRRHEEEAGAPFPLEQLSSLAYFAKMKGSRILDHMALAPSIVDFLMEEKIVLRSLSDPNQRIFRHDRVQDYLVAQHLLTHADLQFEYLDDIRFVGVYTLLAEKLAVEDATLLLSQLALKATVVRDSTILYEFVDRLRSLDKLKTAERAE